MTYDRVRLCGVLSAGFLAFAAGGASAEDGVSIQLAVASEYMGKGLGKSDGDPAVSGSIEYSRAGVYASLFASTAKLSQGSDSEILTTLGYRFAAAGTDFDVSVINRDLPGTRKGVDANYTEYQADASRKFGPVSTRFRVNYTADGFAATQEAWWIELQGGVAVDKLTRATAAIAERTADGGAEYTAWNVGVKRKLADRISLDVRWYDTDGHRYGANYDGRLVAGLTFSL